MCGRYRSSRADRLAAALDAPYEEFSETRIIRDTLNTLQTEYTQPLTAEDALAILLNMGNLFSVLRSTPTRDL